MDGSRLLHLDLGALTPFGPLLSESAQSMDGLASMLT